MGPEKGKSLAPIVSVPIYKTISLKEIKSREQKYAQRIVDTKFLYHFIKEATREFERQNDKQSSLDKWNEYVKCSRFPCPNKASDLRNLQYEMKFKENLSVEHAIDWPLAYDPRSVLTQNAFKREQAQLPILQAMQPCISLDYEKIIASYLRTLQKIDEFLSNKSATANVNIETLNDIKAVERSIQKEICDAMDRFTYRILCAEELLMKSIDSVTAEYGFSCNHFQMHIWSLKNVPIRFSHMGEQRMVAALHNINVYLHIPYSMLRPQLCIQAIHMNFDHVSENAKSNKPDKLKVPLKNWTNRIEDILEKVYKEIEERPEIFEKKISEIDERLRWYSNKLPRTSLDALKRNKVNLLQAVPKLQRLYNDQYPDIENEFVAEESKEYEHFLNIGYNPENFNLEYDEINLRRFAILGGVYQVYCIRKPVYRKIGSWSFTLHSDERKLAVEKDLQINRTYSTYPTHSKFRMSLVNLKDLNRSKSFMTPIDRAKDEIDETNPMFVLTFHLPDYLCYWGDPIACHYEEFEETVCIGDTASDEQQVKPFKTKVQNSIFHSELDMGVISKLKENREKAKRISPTGNILGGELTKSVIQTSNANEIDLNVKDFPLDNPFTSDQARKVVRYCSPQLLSSCKFPVEIKEHKSRHEVEKMKIRQDLMGRLGADHTDKSYCAFGQNNPERIFVVYDRTARLQNPEHLEKFRGILPHEPKAFYQLIKALILIKRLFQYKLYQIFRLESPEPEIDLEVRRVRVRERMLQETKSRLQQLTVKLNCHISQFKAEKRGRRSTRLSKRQSPCTETSTKTLERNSERKTGLDSPISSSSVSQKERATKTVMSSHWTTRHIRSSRFIREERKFVIETDRLGVFGFACRRYQHFPFKYWSLEPNTTGRENEVIFTLDNEYMRCVFYVNEEGIRGHVCEPFKRFVQNPEIYMTIEEPIKDFNQFKKMLRDNNLNIFAEPDASFYIENSYYSVKHLPTEIHTYYCMALHCTTFKFDRCQWNHLAPRRNIVLQFNQYKDFSTNNFRVLIKPEGAKFVEIFEQSSNALYKIKLNYKPTWRNIRLYSDLHQAVCSVHSSAFGLRCKSTKLICNLKTLLSEVRPLSFS
uniref:CASC1 C-terminal domain-containing protein n=1 Tax=Glossina palpalis gambiensis TaxID=67801 RepID=A0A1B0BRY9_9MUSC